MAQLQSYSLMIHGGAGALDNVADDKTAVRYLDSVRRILEHGREILRLGGSALEAVEVCASLLEDDPVFGNGVRAGAVAAVQNIANPIQLARLVMSESEHVMLIGEGAMRFADHCGMAREPDSYFYTRDRIKQLERARLKHKIMLDHDDTDEDSEDQKYGTIGAVARDVSGHLAAATSTGGIVNKRMGRVGDSPIVGAGVYADNDTCAVSATGYGEEFMRTVIAKTIADYVDFADMDATKATEAGIAYLTRKVRGRGGVIVIDRDGRCASGFTTKKMIHGWIEQGGDTIARF